MYRPKRLLSLCIGFLLAATVLTACGGGSPTSVPAAPTAAAPATAGSVGGAATTAATAATGATTVPATATKAAGATTTPATTGATGASTSAAGATTAPAITGASGGTMTGGFDVGPGGAPQLFNPLTAGAGFTWYEKYFSHLMIYDVNFTKLSGDLAESFDASADAKTYTFHLRKGVTWHDGQPFTSDDVKFSIELYKNPDSAAIQAARLANVMSVTTPDPQTAVLNLGASDVTILDTLALVIMLPKHSLASYAPKDLVKNEWWQTNPIGTGPFKWSKYVPDQYTELVAFDGYWRGRPKLDKLINRFFKESGSALIALQKGEIQFTYLTLDEADAAKKNASVTVIPGPSQVANHIIFNIRDPRFQDVRVRQAFQYALDRQQIVDQLYKGNATLTPCIFDNPQYIPKDVTPYKRDVNKAKQLLKDANWNPNMGQPLEIVTYYNDQQSMDVLVALQQQLADAGIVVKVRAVDVPTFNGIFSKDMPDFTLAYAGLGNGPDPDSTSIGYLTTSFAPKGSNRSFYSNPDLDKLYLAGRSELDPAKRAAIYQNACKIENEQLPDGWLWVAQRFGATTKNVQNFIYTPAPGGGRYYDQAELWTVSK